MGNDLEVIFDIFDRFGLKKFIAVGLMEGWK